MQLADADARSSPHLTRRPPSIDDGEEEEEDSEPVCKSTCHFEQKKGKKFQDTKLLDSLYTPFFPVTQPAATAVATAAAGSPNEPKSLPPSLNSNDPSRPLSIRTIPLAR